MHSIIVVCTIFVLSLVTNLWIKNMKLTLDERCIVFKTLFHGAVP